MSAGESMPGLEADNPMPESIFVDPVQLAKSAVKELVMAANSGVFDTERINELIRQLSAIENDEDELLVMRIPRDLI